MNNIEIFFFQGRKLYSAYMERIGGEPNHLEAMHEFMYRLAENVQQYALQF